MTWRLAPKVGHVLDEENLAAYLMKLPDGQIIIASEVGFLICQALIDGADPLDEMVSRFGDSDEVRTGSEAFLARLSSEGLIIDG